MFKRLTIAVVVLAALWGGYWAWGAWSLKSALTQWFAEREAEGWQAEYSGLTVRGFPSRFDTTWTDIALADPDTGLAWEAAFFQVLAVSYQPNHVIAVWPDQHVLSTPEGRITLTNESLQASLVTAATSNLDLERANLAADAMTIRDRNDAVTAIAALRAGVTRVDGTQAQYKIAANADGLALSAPLIQRLGDDLPDSFRTARLDGEVTFDQSWGLSALQDARPQPVAIKLNVAEAEWGPMRLRLAGDLTIDAQGIADGSISIQAQDWRAMVDLAQASGALNPTMAQGVVEGLGLLASMSGNEDSLDVDLRLARGQVFLGIFPLGPAPKIRLR